MSNQQSLGLEKKKAGPVECLGQTFESHAARRDHYLKLLSKMVDDPGFRSTPGFPDAESEEICRLSDPPYYTACPNPWVSDFVNHFGRPYDPSEQYHREPFATDVKEGKNHPIYNAHSYHTKVPHRAIMRYILHYTRPGDVVLDGFAGTGMTGVAAQLCGDRDEVQALGYLIQADGTILNEDGEPFSKIGARHAVLTELSPAASFIAYNYNSPVDAESFTRLASTILAEVEEELGWMFETQHTDGRTKGRINFVVWSDVFVCPECGSEIVFWDAAVNHDDGKVEDDFLCPECSVQTTKRACDRAWVTFYDEYLKTSTKQAKQVPVVINYSAQGKRHEKRPDKFDLALLKKVEETAFPTWVPTNRMMEGGETRRNDQDGVTHVHHFYSPRNRAILAALWKRISAHYADCPTLGLWFTSAHVWATRQNRLLVSNYFKKKGGVIGQTLQGTLYISSIGIETNALERFGLRIKSVPFTAPSRSSCVSTGSSARINAPDSSIDYLFIDPPFGANIAYSELNFLWESWLQVFTKVDAEAIENKPHGKTLQDYRDLIRVCFAECYRVLKPGRWMTIEFSNTRAAVWNSIQSALGEVGFVVANVSVLEKNHKGYRAVTTPTAVKQDLVISAYKPNGGLEQRFAKSGKTMDGVWDFVQTHLRNLPAVKTRGSELIPIAERDPRVIYDRMVAFYVGHGTPVPLSSGEFQAALAEKYPERDNMFFLPEQVDDYDKKRAKLKLTGQLSIFVEDEKSAIEWVRRFLKNRPSRYQDIQPEFTQQLGASWKKWEARPELKGILDDGFLKYDGSGPVPSQIHSYLSSNFKELRKKEKTDPELVARAKDRWYVPEPSRQSDLDLLRERALMREFEEYLQSKQRRLKEFRTEAIRVGFKAAYDAGQYSSIVEVARKLPDKVLEEDESILMYYDVATMRLGEDA